MGRGQEVVAVWFGQLPHSLFHVLQKYMSDETVLRN